jgi:hypothetical protein
MLVITIVEILLINIITLKCIKKIRANAHRYIGFPINLTWWLERSTVAVRAKQMKKQTFNIRTPLSLLLVSSLTLITRSKWAPEHHRRSKKVEIRSMIIHRLISTIFINNNSFSNKTLLLFLSPKPLEVKLSLNFSILKTLECSYSERTIFGRQLKN